MEVPADLNHSDDLRMEEKRIPVSDKCSGNSWCILYTR